MDFFSFITTGFRGSGAPVMFCILAVMFAGMGLIAERFWFLFLKCGKGSTAFMNGIYKFLKAGEYEKALKYAQAQGTPLSKVVVAILQNRGKGVKYVQRCVDEVFLSESPKVARFLPFIQTFANLSVLIGLLGTIYGFMEAFNSLANIPAAQRAQALASSIAVVMSSTLWGLISCIINLGGHAVLANKSDRILEEIDEKSVKLINMVEE
jgi:biopolymer transport protein ExbB